MAPPAKRRKRTVVEASVDDEDAGSVSQQAIRKNSLADYGFSSPTKSPAAAAATASASNSNPPPSPTPLRKLSSETARDRLAKAVPNSVSASPEKKGKATRKAKAEEKGKSGDLVALFSKQAQKARTEPRPNGTTRVDLHMLDDIISDPISEEDEVAEHKTSASSFVGNNARKRVREGARGTVSSAPVPALALASTSQRFLKPPRPTATPAVDYDQRPWSERFGPVNLDELAVHKKKVADVRRWLEDVIGGRMRQRLLILKGAAGTGKTTTLRLLARDMKCEVLEWRNPAGSLGATQGYQSTSAQFEDFIGRGGKFGQLDVDGEDDQAGPDPDRRGLRGPSSSRLNGASSSHWNARRLILIEEFPNTFMRSSSALTSFRKTILQYLAANTPSLARLGQSGSQEQIIPVVMIISETLLTTTSASADSFTAHRLLGPEILRHPGVGVIEFNAIAPSLLAKALEVVVQKEARKSGRRRTPGPLVLKRLGEIGDIRNAISSLEFLCVKGDTDADWGAKVTFTKTKKPSKDLALTKGEQESLELVSQREASLGIFHAVGKVVYNKREDITPADSQEAAAEKLPYYLAHHSRPKRSQVLVDTLIGETGTDTHTFISALHENYILSCKQTGPSDLNSSIDYVDGCIEALSESDMLCPSWDVFFGGRAFAGRFAGRDSGSHVLRQDEMAFQVAVRGMLFSLPYPVKRQSHATGRGGGDQFKMYFPTSIKLWRAKEELEGLLDIWSTKMLSGEDESSQHHQENQQQGAAGRSSAPSTSFSHGASAFRRAGNTVPSNVGDMITSNPAINYRPSNQLAKTKGTTAADATDTSPPPTPLLSLGNAARREMLLERLPYMAHIARSRRTSFYSMSLRDMEKVVSFQGIGGPSAAGDDDVSDDIDDNGPEDDTIIGGTGGEQGGESWATDKPTDEGASPQKKRKSRIVGAIRGGQGGRGRGGGGDKDETRRGGPGFLAAVNSLSVHKLVLSDDDIED